MAAYIDTKHMVEHWIPDHEHHLDDALGGLRRLKMHRVRAHATVIHDPAMMKRLSEARGQPLNPRKQALLNWQPSQDDDQHDWEVFKDLHELYTTSTSFPDKSDFAITRHVLIASAESRSFSARMQGRPASSFRRYSIKISMLRNDRNGAYGMYLITHTDLQQLFGPNAVRGNWCKWGYEPKIFCSNTRHNCAVFWQIQIDFVDLEETTSGFQLGKRRREMNLFLQISDHARLVEDRSRVIHALEAKKFRGVRYRPDRKTWVAEMKRPRSKNKTSFGDFKSAIHAARAVDVAFYHYDKISRLNFADTPQILATWSPLVGLNDEEKLRLVKEQAKWVALSGLPPSLPTSLPFAGGTTWVPFEAPEYSTDTSGFRSFSGITSSMSTSQPLLPQLHQNPMTIVSNGVRTMASNLTTAGLGFELQEGQNMVGWSEGSAIEYPVDRAITQTAEIPATTPNSEWSNSSTSMHITEPWDSPWNSSGFFTPFGSPSGDCDEIQIDSPFLSEPTPMFDQVTRNPY